MVGARFNGRVGIVDNGMGNLFSVAQALHKVGLDPILVDVPTAAAQWDALVIPGVGAMPKAMASLRRSGWDSAIRDHAQAGRPTLGVCLGMQLLFDTSSEHGQHPGLGLVPGHAVRIPESLSNGERRLVPHIGWNAVHYSSNGSRSMLRKIPSGTPFYFVHSFVCVPTHQEHVVATTVYAGFRFCSAIQAGMITGCQFHPERSGTAGLQLFVEFRKLIEQHLTVQR